MSLLSNDYVLKLREMIKCDTISSSAFFNEKKSRTFQEVLSTLFPNVFSKCRIKDLDGSIIVELIGRRSSAPILYLCHFDTVDIKGNWKHDPLKAETDDTKLYGRGTLDAKGNLFCILQAFEELIQEGYVPAQDVYVASVCDKESNNEAIQNIYNYFKNSSTYFGYILDEGGYVVNAPLVGMSKDYAMIGLGESAHAVLKFTVSGNGGRSSYFNKKAPLFDLLAFVQEFEYDDVFKKSINDSLHDIFHQFSEDMTDYNKYIFANSKFCSPLVKISLKKQPLAMSMISSSLSIVSINTTESSNTIASEVSAIGNLHISLDDTLEECLDVIGKIAEYYGVKVEVLNSEDKSRVTNPKSYQYIEFEETVKEVFNDATVVPFISNVNSNLRVMDRLCSNSFRFVPLRVTTDQIQSIHGVDENIDIASLDKGVAFYKKLIRK